MRIIIELPKTTVQLLKQMGNILSDQDGVKCYSLPFWFKETARPDIYEVFTLDEMSAQLKTNINEYRNKT